MSKTINSFFKVSPDSRKNPSKSPKEKVRRIVANKIFQLDDIASGDKESYEPLFSDDLGPAESLDTKGLRVSSKENNNSQKFRSSDLDLRKKIKDLEADNNKYKVIIENMANEMDNVRNRMLTNNQELNFQKEENFNLRNRIHHLQEELLTNKERMMNMASEKNLFYSKLQELEGLKNKRGDEEVEALKEEIKSKEKEILSLNSKVKNV